MIAVCVGLFLGALGSAARFLQGNGHAGPGRWSLYGVCLLAAMYGLHDEVTTKGQWVAVLWTGLFAAANIGMGYTRWENIPYSFARYTLPALMAVLPWIVLGHEQYVLYALVGPLIAVNQFVLAQHKPGWINTPFDVATIPAGFAVAAPIAFF